MVKMPEKELLMEIFLAEAPQIPGNGARKRLLDTCKSHVLWETPRGRYDECSSKFSLKKETKVIEPVGLETAPAHNTTKKLCPNVTVRLSISPAC